MSPLLRAAMLCAGVAIVPTIGLAQARARSGGARAKATSGAAMAGFETQADGSTRLFVELSHAVSFEEKAAPGVNTYVLKGAHVRRHNDCNPLVTVDFNTPVRTARLVPHGKDLWFVVELRANVSPTASVDPKKDGSALFRVDFPKGDYLPAKPAPSAQPSASASADSP
jgi:hypothetical protein